MREFFSIQLNLVFRGIFNLARTVSFMSVSMVVSMTVSQTSKAATLKLYVSTSQGVDPENGSYNYQILNPSGEVNVTFIRGGLQFVYLDEKGASVTRHIYEDFRRKDVDSEETDFRRRFEKFKYEASKSRGIGIARGFLGYLSDFSKEKETPVIVYFNPQGQVGFMKLDHTFSNVFTIVPGSGQPPVSFEDAVYTLLRPELTNAVIESFKAESPRKNPIGFAPDYAALAAKSAKPAAISEGQCALIFPALAP